MDANHFKDGILVPPIPFPCLSINFKWGLLQRFKIVCQIFACVAIWTTVVLYTVHNYVWSEIHNGFLVWHMYIYLPNWVSFLPFLHISPAEASVLRLPHSTVGPAVTADVAPLLQWFAGPVPQTWPPTCWCWTPLASGVQWLQFPRKSGWSKRWQWWRQWFLLRKLSEMDHCHTGTSHSTQHILYSQQTLCISVLLSL